VLSVAGIYCGHRKLDPRVTDQGMYLYGYREPEGRHVIYFKEGASCNVTVTEHFIDRALAVNGKVDATSQGDMDMQLGIAVPPRFLRPEAKNVLVIGYGSGTTSGASLLFPGTRVTCCEIEPAVFGASPEFSRVNHAPEKNPNFTIVFDDGRSHLQGTGGNVRPHPLRALEPVARRRRRPLHARVLRRLPAEARGARHPRPVDPALLLLRGRVRARDPDRDRRRSATPPCSASAAATRSCWHPTRRSFPTAPTIDASQKLLDGLPEIRDDLKKHLDGDDVRSVLLPRLLLDEAG
jgi:hypothetical protein